MKTIFFLGCLIFIGLLSLGKAFGQDNHAASVKKVITLYPVKITYPPAKLMVYPNPAGGEVEISLEGIVEKDGEEKFTLTLSDKQGIQLIGQKWTGEKIDVSAFPPGVYIVTLKRKQEVYSQKLVVNR